MAVVTFLRYFGFRARISSKLRSSGGCIIFDVVPLAGIFVEDFACSWFCTPLLGAVFGLLLPPGVLVVGGALIVALLKTYRTFRYLLDLDNELSYGCVTYMPEMWASVVVAFDVG